jgi:hypothetical protein
MRPQNHKTFFTVGVEDIKEGANEGRKEGRVLRISRMPRKEQRKVGRLSRI